MGRGTTRERKRETFVILFPVLLPSPPPGLVPFSQVAVGQGGLCRIAVQPCTFVTLLGVPLLGFGVIAALI